MSIYGDDYDTRDGTCVRDYIHVTDLAQAHILAMEYLNNGGESNIFNLGNGVGFTVKEVIDTARKVTGHPIPAQTTPAGPATPPSWWRAARRPRPSWAGSPSTTTWRPLSPAPGSGTRAIPTATGSKKR